MSSQSHNNDYQPANEQGLVKSYVTGFLLSLVFTFIPYEMVVRRSVSGTAILATILGFALSQMIIQIIFFLHLGSGPKPRWNLYFFVATFGIVLFVVGGSILIIHNLHYNMQPSDQVAKLVNDEGIAQVGDVATGACQGQHANHQIIIKDDALSPSHTVASKCDTLTFIDQDSGTRAIAFGPHIKHVAYAGQTEFILRKGQNVTITLSQSGTYSFHDHFNETITGDFTVLQ